MKLAELVVPIDHRSPPQDARVLSVSEGLGIVPQDQLFKKRVALDDLSKYKVVEEGDLVFNPFLLWNGAVGACFIRNGGCVSPAYVVLRPRARAAARFLHYFMRSDRFTTAVDGIASGTVTRRRTAPLSDVLALDFTLPDQSEQEVIADLLGAFDSKIESNQRIAQMIESLLALELECARDATWTQRPISSVAKFVNGGAYTKGATGSGRMVIRIAELRSGPTASTVYNELDVSDDQLARPGDLLMAWSGSLGIHRWAREEALINQHIFKVICSDYPPWLVYTKLAEVMPKFRQIAADKATTMGHIKRHHLDDVAVQIPSTEALGELDRALAPLWDRLLAAEGEDLTVAALRDTLLPELLSARLDVGALIQSVEAAT